MGYRFEREEEVAAGVHRIAHERLAKALRHVELGSSGDASALSGAVHGLRTCCKQTRGLLRLVEPALGTQFAALNSAVRSAARAVALERDRAVLFDRHAELAAALSTRLDEPAARAIAAALGAQQGSGDLEQTRAGLALAGVAIRGAVALLHGCEIEGSGFDLIADGLGRSYSRARRASRSASERATPKQRHEWRKRVKETWYHVRLLAPTWPKVMVPLAEEAQALARALGAERDFGLLAERVEALGAGADCVPSAYRDELAADSDRARRAAMHLARRLFAERRVAMVARHRALWRAWRGRR